MDHPMLTAFVSGCEAGANPARALQQAAYMKRSLPFYGLGRAELDALRRGWTRRFPLEEPSAYRALIEALWALPYQECRYQAVWVARTYTQHITLEHLPLYRAMIEDAAWWDVVDELAAHLVGRLLLQHREVMTPVMRAWSEDPHLWVRRAAILSQLTHKERVDAELLFTLCRERAHERDFFIRKAIGWALRQHSKVAPNEVRAFLDAHREALSGLSYREGARHLRQRDEAASLG